MRSSPGGCFVSSSDPVPDAGADAAQKTCWTPNAQYAVTFTLVSGNCPNVDGNVSYQWLNPDGSLNIPSNCTEHGTHSMCTSWIDETCIGLVYKQVLMGELDWSPSGQTAHGLLTFTATELQNDYVFCSSVYNTNYTLQWQAAN